MRRMLVRELWQLPRCMGGAAGGLMYVLAIAAAGVFAPWYLGLDFFDIHVLLACACLSVLVAGPVMAESVAGDRERAAQSASAEDHKNLLRAQLGAAALCGWIFTLIILALAITTVRFAFGRLIAPPAQILIDLAAISLAVSLCAASLSAAVSSRAKSAKHAKGNLRQGFLLVLVLVIYYARFMPQEWKEYLTFPITVSGFTGFIAVSCVLLVALSAGLVRLALARLQDTEIRLNL
ncbi:MAG TPA: hypothetical protein VJN43_01530 [Bryobacteraceae bacterium]|nr:hypothetical protein [Bryobacteraceae bacterium]